LEDVAKDLKKRGFISQERFYHTARSK
jgi:hypothetical protein